MIQYVVQVCSTKEEEEEEEKGINIHYSKPDVNASFVGSIKRS
jgi:hypothetical protein